MNNRNKPIVRDLSNSLGKLPPQALDLEESILGALLIEKNAIIQVAEFLRSEHFYSDQHSEIYKAIMDLFTKGDPIDMRTVVASLRKGGKLEITGGAFYIAELTSKVSSASNIEYHSRIIIELSMKRELILIASEIHSKAYDDTIDVFELKDFAHGRIEMMDEDNSGSKNMKSVKQIVPEAFKNLQSRMSGVITGISSGFVDLDRIIFGWRPGLLVVIGGRPAMGKSVFGFQAVYTAAKQFNVPVGAFSMEMTAIEQVDRHLCADSEIESDKIKHGNNISGYEFERISSHYGKLADCPYYIDESPALHISDLRARARRMVNKFGVKIILVDYIQLMRGKLAGEQINRDQELGNITRGLKAIAKENNITVLAISMLSRAVEQRGGDKRPQLSDLRESGSIEADADIVMFLYRPEYYKITTDTDGYPTHGLAEVIVAKHRGGNVDTAKLRFVGKFTKFMDWQQENTPRTVTERQQFGASHYKNPSEKLPNEFNPDDNPF